MGLAGDHFRDESVAASLKPIASDLRRARPTDFRDESVAASLKPHCDIARHRCRECDFRDESVAASLKLSSSSAGQW